MVDIVSPLWTRYLDLLRHVTVRAAGMEIAAQKVGALVNFSFFLIIHINVYCNLNIDKIMINPFEGDVLQDCKCLIPEHHILSDCQKKLQSDF